MAAELWDCHDAGGLGPGPKASLAHRKILGLASGFFAGLGLLNPWAKLKGLELHELGLKLGLRWA